MRRLYPPMPMSRAWLRRLSVGMACALRAPVALAGCDTTNPQSGQTATCSAGAPNPSAISVSAPAGSTGVSVFVLPGAVLNVSNGNVILVQDHSTVLNQGTLNQSADENDAISSQGTIGHNVLTNSGTITTLGIQSEGIFNSAAAAVMTNTATGAITTRGAGSSAMFDFDSPGSSVLRNDGSITTLGDNSNGMAAIAPGDTFINNGTITTSGTGAAGLYANSSGVGTTLTNHGVIDVSGPDSHGIVSLDTTPGPMTNTGSITSHQGIGIYLQHGVTFTNGPGASVTSMTSDGIVANDGGTFTNAGTISGGNEGLAVNAGDTTLVNSGTISGGSNLGISTTGPYAISIVNTGNIAGGNGVAVWTDTGTNMFEMDGGTVTGLVRQGTGINSFIMNNGQIDAVDQGGPQPTFSMTGGHVVGALTNAGAVSISGGRIGSVNMTASRNTFSMSGGQVDTSVIAGAGATSFNMSGGNIGGPVALGDGANIVTVTGGTIAQGLSSGDGPLQFKWLGGGAIAGTVTFGAGSAVAVLSNLGDSELSGLLQFDGGAGTDSLTFDNVSTGNSSRFINWENVGLTHGSRLTLDATGLVLGDSGTQTGTLTIDTTSQLQWNGSGGSSIVPASSNALVNVRNAGTINLTGGAGTQASLTVVGNYVGQGGRLLLQSELGGSASPSGKLVIAQGAASGATLVGIVNAGGLGALTQGDGIMVVQAVQGATTAVSAFSLAAPVKAGAYSYLLVRGGAAVGAADNWYLRSNLTPVIPPPPPPPPVTPPTPPTPPGTPTTPTAPSAPSAPSMPSTPSTPSLPSSPTVITAAPSTPVYRIEVPLYAGIPSLVRELGIEQTGTFNERQGDPSLLSENGVFPASWARIWANHASMSSTTGTDPHFSGTTSGVQIGQDIYSNVSAGGESNHYGFLIGFTHASGDASGSAMAVQSVQAGQDSIDAATLGLYWTLIGRGGWYVDTLLTGSRLHIQPSSSEGVDASTHGNLWTGSVEGGLPFIVHGLQVEPQAQLVWQHASIDDFSDSVSTVAFSNPTTLAARLGVRFSGQWQARNATWQPFAAVNVWRYMGGTSQVTFAGTTTLPADTAATLAQLQAGLVIDISKRGSVFVNASYAVNVGGASRSTLGANGGVRFRW